MQQEVHTATISEMDPRKLAHRKGFEPLTPRFVVWCSIQLSYRCGGTRNLMSAGAASKPPRRPLFAGAHVVKTAGDSGAPRTARQT